MIADDTFINAYTPHAFLYGLAAGERSPRLAFDPLGFIEFELP